MRRNVAYLAVPGSGCGPGAIQYLADASAMSKAINMADLFSSGG